MVTLYCVVHGAVYERYAARLRADALRFFLPGESEFVLLPGRPAARSDGWSHVSATRYRVLLDHLPLIHGDWIFQIDADSRIVNPVGREILADGVTVTTHPGHPPGRIELERDGWPYERRGGSRAYVPYGHGTQYHPGAFTGGSREAFLEMAAGIAEAVEDDLSRDVRAVWYEESHLNRWLLDHPPALVLDRRYCWWDQQWGDDPAALGAKIVHLDKTVEEFALRS
jgi:hypothetical protein